MLLSYKVEDIFFFFVVDIFYKEFIFKFYEEFRKFNNKKRIMWLKIERYLDKFLNIGKMCKNYKVIDC